jgi:hypothetical protein
MRAHVCRAAVALELTAKSLYRISQRPDLKFMIAPKGAEET